MPESSKDLLAGIHSRDRKYRVAFVMLMFLVLVVLGSVILLQARALGEFQAASQERADAVARRDEKNLEVAGRTNAYLQCLARFFAETDRTDLTLTDLDKCNYERNGTTVPGVDVTPTSSTPSLTTAPTEEPTAPLQVTQPTPTPTPAVTPPNPIIPVPEPPLRICVPLTQVCVVL